MSMDELGLDQAAFRAVSANYATGIAVVTCLSAGADHAMTANSFTTVSLDPLLVSVCVQRDTRFHEAVMDSGRWGASFLSSEQAPLARWFATRGRPLAQQFAGIPTLRTSGGVLVLAESLAAVTATTAQVVTAGDHDVLLAQVTGLFRGRPDTGPTVYFQSTYGLWRRAGSQTPTI